METTTKTITLTNHPPVTIREDEWPIIATGSADDDDSSQPGNPPNRDWTRTIRVRKHVDGRAIVYGVYNYDTAFPGENGAAAKRGMLQWPTATPLGPAGIGQIIAAIRAVGGDLAEAEEMADIEPARKDARRWREAVQACIADLPPVAI
jgi:hypothetical protein